MACLKANNGAGFYTDTILFSLRSSSVVTNLHSRLSCKHCYFISIAMTVGPNTVELIKAILVSRKYEVQTYRLCVGVLNYRKSYSKSILEECCRQALEMNHPTYTFVKNTIAAIASEHSKKDLIQQNNARNKNAYVMGSDAYELDHLLSKSSDLAKNSNKGGDRK